MNGWGNNGVSSILQLTLATDRRQSCDMTMLSATTVVGKVKSHVNWFNWTTSFLENKEPVSNRLTVLIIWRYYLLGWTFCGWVTPHTWSWVGNKPHLF